MGAEVTVCGPPTLIPRGIEELGCEVSHSLDRLGEAEVVYALRMQQERMSESFVPSLREYAATFQIDTRKLNPRQLLMHPGPVNRGVELSGEAIDSPQSLIAEQVAAGLVVRMAILYELLAGGERPQPLSRWRGRRPADPDRTAGMSLTDVLDVRPGEAANLILRRATVLDPVAGIDGVHDVVVRDGEIAELAAPGRRRRRRGRGRRGRGPARLPRLLRSARPPPHARPRAQRGRRDGHPRRRRRRLLRDPRDGQHRAAGLDRRRHHGAARAGPGGRLGPGRLPRHGHPRA